MPTFWLCCHLLQCTSHLLCKSLNSVFTKDQRSPHMDWTGFRHSSSHSPTNPSLYLLSNHFFPWHSSRRDSCCLGIICDEVGCQRVRCIYRTFESTEIRSVPALSPRIHYLFVWTMWFRQFWFSRGSDWRVKCIGTLPPQTHCACSIFCYDLWISVYPSNCRPCVSPHADWITFKGIWLKVY